MQRKTFSGDSDIHSALVFISTGTVDPGRSICRGSSGGHHGSGGSTWTVLALETGHTGEIPGPSTRVLYG